MSEQQRKAASARWKKWYAMHRGYKRSHARKEHDKKYRASHYAPLISAEQVRREEGLDKHTKIKHTCHAYPPFWKCTCRECRARAAAMRDAEVLRLQAIAD